MRRLLWLFAASFLYPCLMHAQGTHIASFPTDPATCDPTRGTVIYNTTSATMKYCSAVNTWSPLGGVSPNSPLPASSSGPGPVFNVKNYGAKGDTQSSGNCTASSFNLNCTDATFTTANVGNRISCASAFSTFQFATAKFSAFVNATNMTMDTSNNGTGTCIWGTPDDTAVLAALAAATAQMCSIVSSGNLCTSTSAPTLYFPAGTYNLFNTAINASKGGAPVSGFAIRGDGADQTKVYWNTGSTNGVGAAVTCTNVQNFVIEGFTMDGAQGAHSFSNAALYLNCGTLARNIIVQRFNGVGIFAPNTVYGNKIVSAGNNGTGMLFQGSADMYESLSTNNFGNNLLVQNVAGVPFGAGFRWTGGLFDEGGIAGASVQVANSSDVWFISAPVFTGVTVDGHSYVHFVSSQLGPFSNDNNVAGLTVATGGTVQASDTRFVSSGTGKCINNSGAFLDNGGNSCENMFQITSGTSTGTTAVLTVQGFTANANTNCTVGDALQVTGAGIAGYNGYYPAGATSGITAVTATTITYTTVGSNLGALGASGSAFCRNMQSYAGTLPKALLNNPIPNTYYVTITPIVNATTYQMGNFGVATATNISRITASSQNVTTCATAPIITISNGTVSETLTLTSGKQNWDSFNAQDASTGVGTTIFKPSISATGTDRITIKYDAGALSACATPPTQLAVSLSIGPTLSN